LLRGLQPDLLVVAAYGQLLKPDVIASARHGPINVHASLLPKYRGAAPIAWAIYHGETQTGVTIIQIIPGMDAGPMLAQEVVPIGPDETAGEVEARLSVVGAQLAVRVIEQFASGTPPAGEKQDPTKVTKAPKLTKEHGVIDWFRRAEQVCCQVRAMSPWPTAYTFWHRPGQPALRLIVHQATARPATEGEALLPGEVKVGQHTTLCVGAGEKTVVEVHELQPAGKPRMKARDFLNGRRPQPGDRLGPEVP
jgi:methionyl-tRNA formyltransferase